MSATKRVAQIVSLTLSTHSDIRVSDADLSNAQDTFGTDQSLSSKERNSCHRTAELGCHAVEGFSRPPHRLYLYPYPYYPAAAPTSSPRLGHLSLEAIEFVTLRSSSDVMTLSPVCAYVYPSSALSLHGFALPTFCSP